MTITNEIVQRVKDEALALESGMFTSEEEYVAAMNELIAHFTVCRDNCLEIMNG